MGYTVSEQKKEEYKRNRKIKETSLREKRRAEKNENNTSNRRLSFLTKIFKALGYNKVEIAKLAGETEQSLYWKLNTVDDCKLSQAQRYLELIGLNLKVRLDNKKSIAPIKLEKNKSGMNNGVKFKIEGDIFEDDYKINTKYPDFIVGCAPGSRLYFLAEYIMSLNVRFSVFLEKVEMEFTSMKRYFSTDDIKISVLFKIAEKTEGDIVYIINKKEENN